MKFRQKKPVINALKRNCLLLGGSRVLKQQIPYKRSYTANWNRNKSTKIREFKKRGNSDI